MRRTAPAKRRVSIHLFSVWLMATAALSSAAEPKLIGRVRSGSPETYEINSGHSIEHSVEGSTTPARRDYWVLKCRGVVDNVAVSKCALNRTVVDACDHYDGAVGVHGHVYSSANKLLKIVAFNLNEGVLKFEVTGDGLDGLKSMDVVLRFSRGELGAINLMSIAGEGMHDICNKDDPIEVTLLPPKYDYTLPAKLNFRAGPRP